MDYYTFVILPFLIFLARVADVSIDTVRIIFIAKGFKGIAPVLGFVEVMIWLLAARQVFSGDAGWIPMIAYAAGFGTGTYVGILLEEKLSLGKVILRIVTQEDAKKLLAALHEEQFPMTISHAVTQKGKVNIIYVIMNRKKLHQALDLVREYNPSSAYSVEDVRLATEKNGKYHARHSGRRITK